jgi:hypothetical protein
MRIQRYAVRIGAAVVAGIAALSACGGDSTSPGPPQVLNINNSSEPASPVNVSIEINGSNFLGSPGRVDFTQGANVAQITPDPAGWSQTGVIVTVPSNGAAGAFTVPGTVSVTVVTAGGTSNAINLELVTVPTFSVENVEWATTTALPVALRGLGAAPVPNTSTSAYVVVAGGNDGTTNVVTVYSNTLNQDGTLGGSWTTTMALPAARAHHAVALAHPGNSPVASTARFLYVIGGQQTASDAPGGTSTVYVGTVSLANGAVSSWTTTAALPQTLVAPSAAAYNGYLYVVGGLRSDGTPSSAVYSARIGSDGALGTWATSSNAYPAGVAFAQAFGFGGNLYVLGGETATTTDPNAQGTGVKSVRYAPVRSGVVGAWVATEEIVKQRKKHVVWTAFGQTIVAEGVYEGSPGNLELERSSILSTGAFAAWNGITSSANQIGANVYNAGAFVSPIRPSGGGPRFLLLGGQRFVLTPPGPVSATVYYNIAP